MINIGVVDDRRDYRESIKLRMEQSLTMSGNTGVSIIAIEPLPNVGDYSHWIQTEGICALLIDELLSEGPLSTGVTCDYEGHDMAATLRQRADDIPIFVVTSASINANLEENPGLFETVLQKDDFGEQIDGYMQRILRSAHRYLEETQAMYTELSVLAQRVALRSATKEDEERLGALQAYLHLRVNAEEQVTRSAMLAELQEKLVALESAMAEAKKFLA